MYGLGRLLDQLLSISQGHNKNYTDSLMRIKSLYEHGFRIGYIDVYSTVKTDIILKHNREQGNEYEPWELETIRIVNSYLDKIEASQTYRLLLDLCDGLDKKH